MRVLRQFCAALLFCQLLCWGARAEPPTPPGQPRSGPGGAEYKHAAVRKAAFGVGGTRFWLFEPAEPTPRSAPVVALFHGWSGVNPMYYGAWIEHLARRGNIVIWPRYQATALDIRNITQNSVNALRAALARLQDGAHVAPELDKFALVGHSLGGTMAANVAARAQRAGLPKPRALMLVQPGDTKGSVTAQRLGLDVPSVLEDYSTIPSDVLMLIVVGEEDRLAGNQGALFFHETPQVPLQNKDYIILRSDRHGSPPLVAHHFCPCALDERYDNGERPLWRARGRRALFSEALMRKLLGVDALDYFGTWKLLDGLTDAAFYGKNRDYALGNTQKQRFMGVWSDGVPVRELVVTDNPPAVARP